MKILIVTEDVPPQTILGGAGKHAVLLSNALIANGHEVEILGCATHGNVHKDIGFNGKFHTLIDMRRIGLKEVALGVFNPIRKLIIANRLWSAIKQLPYKQFDVIHYHGHTVELGVLVPKYINFVHTLHDQGSECMTMTRFKNGTPCSSKSAISCAGCATENTPNLVQKLISALAVKLHRYLARSAFKKHKAIFVSDFLLTRFKENVGNCNNLKATVIHNFTDAQAIKKIVNNKAPIRGKNSRPIVLIAGRVHSSKGQQAFLEALPDSLLNKIEIRIAGDGPDLATLKATHENRGVTFLGWLSQEDIYKETMLADACVVPSIWEEPCGTTSLEALTMGKTVFALSRGGTPEQVNYCSYPNQLRLFESIPKLTEAFAKQNFSNNIGNISYKADVSVFVPEIINFYKKNI